MFYYVKPGFWQFILCKRRCIFFVYGIVHILGLFFESFVTPSTNFVGIITYAFSTDDYVSIQRGRHIFPFYTIVFGVHETIFFDGNQREEGKKGCTSMKCTTTLSANRNIYYITLDACTMYIYLSLFPLPQNVLC